MAQKANSLSHTKWLCEYHTMQETKRSLSFMMILSAFMAFASLSTDIYLPAMPAMQDDLGGAVALTITSFLVGFAIAQLVWGPISDHIGRRMPLAIGALLFFSVHFLPSVNHRHVLQPRQGR